MAVGRLPWHGTWRANAVEVATADIRRRGATRHAIRNHVLWNPLR
jgi:hypothetical protein